MGDLNTIISRSAELTVEQGNNVPVSGVLPVFWMAKAGLYVSPWWSPSRDIDLRVFWKKSDHLSGAIYTMQSKMASIDFKVVARDGSVSKYADEAESYTDLIRNASQLGDGWVNFFGRWVEDYLTQDNGAFAEVIGTGNPEGPIMGAPLSMRHLDSFRCQRTGNSEYPVIYTDTDGKMYKLHHSRVIHAAQMSSPIQEMFGVGFCAVSRCIGIAQNLIDMIEYKQEKLGSRPHRGIIITKGGLDPEDVRSAFQMAEGEMHSQGLRRYSKLVVAGSSSLQEASLEIHSLSEMPDGFDEETGVMLGMATIALALGMDARELFPALQSGATRADAVIQHLKQRGKGPGQILQVMEHAVNFKFMPNHLKFVFDFQDDTQDQQVAAIRLQRANKRVQDVTSGAARMRAIREQMVDDGDLTLDQFIDLELEDGRLEDGTDVLALFYSSESAYQRMLDIGIDDPLDVYSNDPDAVIAACLERMADVYKALLSTGNKASKIRAKEAYWALKHLMALYEKKGNQEEEQMQDENGQRIDTRMRTETEGAPTEEDTDPNQQDSSLGYDDERDTTRQPSTDKRPQNQR